MHQRQTNQVEELYRQAAEYRRRGDVYNAVKLCKLMVKKSPDWSAPYACLSNIYRNRNEWRPTLHYSLKAAEHNPFDDTTWENMALAATVLENWRTARQAWNQLGFKFRDSEEEPRLDLGIVPVRINPLRQPEIVEASRIGPARAIIQSIPQPSSGRRYGDMVLLESNPGNKIVVQGKKHEVFNELDVLSTSTIHAYSAVLETDNKNEIGILAKLCKDAGIGFDNWSNAARFFQSNLHPKVVEYYDKSIFGKLVQEAFLVAIAARTDKEVLNVLRNWEVITLRKFYGLERLC